MFSPANDDNPLAHTWAGRYVRIAKVAQTIGGARPGSWDEYNQGDLNPGVSLPLNYWSEGFIVFEPTVGLKLIVDRATRNGEDVDGFLETSRVVSIEPVEDGLRVTTKNSVYMVSPRPAMPERMPHVVGS